jgi:hypothetical protein
MAVAEVAVKLSALLLAAMTQHAAIECRPTPGPNAEGPWAWREIDGRRCYYAQDRGRVPPKSEFTWGAPAPAPAEAGEPPWRLLTVRPVDPVDKSPLPDTFERRWKPLEQEERNQ